MPAGLMDPASPSVRVDGPPPGMASGRYDVPRVAIALFGGAIVLAGVIYIATRFARKPRA